MAAYGIRVTSTSGALTVTITGPAGGAPHVYSDEALTAAVSLPATVADATSSTFYVASPGTYNLSVKTAGGTEIAAAGNTTRNVDLESAGTVAKYSYDTRLYAAVSGDSGSSAGGGAYVTFVQAAGAADTAAIQAAFNALKSAGVANGEVRVRGVAALDSTLVLDGGYTDVTNENNWNTDHTSSIRLVGTFKPAAGIGQAIVVKNAVNPLVEVSIQGGGQSTAFTDGAIAAGSAVLTSAAAAAVAKAGQVLRINGAGQLANGVAQPFFATVVSVAGSAVTLNDTATTAVASGGTGRVEDVGVHLENVLLPVLDIAGKHFSGTLLHADATGDTTKRVRSVMTRRIQGIGCSRTVFLKNVESFGSLGLVWSNPINGPDYFGYSADTGWTHWEGGVGATPNTNSDAYLWLESCNNFNVDEISLGDRATTALMRITGSTAHSSDVGTINSIRVSALQPGGVSTYVGLEVTDVHSLNIDTLRTFRCATGAKLTGSNVMIKAHYSQTADTNALAVYGSTYQAAPIVDVKGWYRFTNADPVLIDASVTGGHVKISGQHEATIAQTSPGTCYNINSASTGTLNLTGLVTDTRTGLAGLTNHPGTFTGDTPRVVRPRAHNYLAWTGDPANCGQTNVGPATSKPLYSLIPVPDDLLVSTVSYMMVTAGTAATFTSGQNFLALYNLNGDRIGVSADISAQIGALATNQELPAALTAPVFIKGGPDVYVYAAILLNWSAGTAPLLLGQKAVSGAMQNIGCPTTRPRAAFDGIARTATVTNKAITALSQNQGLAWAALS